jgi:D-lactate dehydrogenase
MALLEPHISQVGQPDGHGTDDKLDGGALPIVVDAVCCTHGLIENVGTHLDDEHRSRFEQPHLIDGIEWTHGLLRHLSIRGKRSSALVHPTCSTLHLGLEEKLVEIARAVAEEVVVPIGTTCCGTAGDRGLLHPELVRSATREEAAYAAEHPADLYPSANRTCEMGLLDATGRPYESFVFEVEALTRPESPAKEQVAPAVDESIPLKDQT